MKDPFQDLSPFRPIAPPADLYQKIMDKVAQQEADRLPVRYVRIAAIILFFLWGATFWLLLQPTAVTAAADSDTFNLYPT
ncbi:MAG TPA: hypothetical protein PK230_11460, partial [Chitinophagales bacterium]|nr:hypothetical protein [Chitinophagales bacterium]